MASSRDQLVSVIIVTYNSGKFIGPCLDSVRRSDYRNLEIIVVDNASQDDTVKLLTEHYSEIPLVENKSNLGFAVGNNKGMKIANGDYFFLLNPDTCIESNCISELVAASKEDEMIGCLGGKIYNFDGSIQSAGGRILLPGRTQLVGHMQIDQGQFNKKREVQYVDGAAFMVTKSALRKVGLLDTRYFMYCDETDWEWRARKVGFKIAYVPTAVVHHYGGGSRAGINSSQYIESSRILFAVKNYAFSMLLQWLVLEWINSIGLMLSISKRKRKRNHRRLKHRVSAYGRNLSTIQFILKARLQNGSLNKPEW